MESILAASAEASGIMTPRGRQRQPGHGVRVNLGTIGKVPGIKTPTLATESLHSIPGMSVCFLSSERV